MKGDSKLRRENLPHLPPSSGDALEETINFN